MAVEKIEESVKKETPVLKKRTLPEDGIKKEKDTSSPILKKRELPLDEKKPLPEKKKASEAPKEKSSLDQMKERIAAQKKLEQDMMTKQSLRNQEKVGLRNKLSALAKDIAEEETEVRQKPVIELDLKGEAIEAQNKKLKADLEKYKNQLHSLQLLEYENVRVLDIANLSLNEDFISSISNLKDNSNNEEKILLIENEKQNLEEKIKELSKEIKEKEKQIEKINETKEAAVIDKQNLQTENNKLNIQINELLEKLSSADAENKSKDLLTQELESLKQKLDDQEKVHQENLQSEINKSNTLIADLENKLKELESVKSNDEVLLKEKENLEKELQELKDTYKELSEKSSTVITELENKLKELEAAKSNDEVLLKEKENLEKELQLSQEVLNNKNNEIVSLSKKLDESQKLQEELTQVMNSSVNTKELEAKEKEISELKIQIEALQKENTELKETKKSEEKEGLSRIKISDDIGQKDLIRIKEVQLEIINLNSKISDNNNTVSELTEQFNRFMNAKNQIAAKSKNIRKYNDLILELNAIKVETQKVVSEVSEMNPKDDKKAYRAKSALAKSLTAKTIYLEKNIKKLQRKKQIIEYNRLLSKIKEFNEQFASFEKRNQELNQEIANKEKELQILKG